MQQIVRNHLIRRIFSIYAVLMSLLLNSALAENTDSAVTQVTQSQNYVVTLTPVSTPVEVGEIHGWTLTLQNREGETVNGAVIKVRGGMPHHGHGFPTHPVVSGQLESGDYLLEGLKFSMKGAWVIELNISVDGTSDKVRFNLDI
ncbi:FixH family protein [Pontibacterium granulatum]|uniref:FixH family protein n=1 Tax=Pontibacterium granulatum TaxID=2036029 RepID=UPI00249A1222|nr:FixH family protein [Pontibacterium granulatum]MDI3326176.1 FixH family protein [Pontibacterium granulatum]